MRRLVSLILSLLIASALLSVTACALPRTFDKTRVHRLDDYRVELAIGDMKFQGMFTNAELTDEKLEELVRKVLDEMGLDEADFDLLNDLVNAMNEHNSISPERLKKIFDRWFDMLGAVPYLGQATTLVQVIMQLGEGDYVGPAQSAAEEAGSQFLEGLGESLDDTGKYGKHAGKVWGIGKALKAVIEGMMESDAGERAIDRALGLQAYQLLNDFYGKLNKEVDKHFKDNAANFMVKFDKATAEGSFALFGTQNTEQWTLDMTLFQTESYSRLDIDGVYEGQYAIEIAYDLAGFQGGLNGVVQTPEWKDTYAFPEWVRNFGPFHTDVTSSGSCDVKRTLSGYATATLYRKGGTPSIKPSQDRDEKDANIAGIVFQASAADKGYGIEIEWLVCADGDAFTNTSGKASLISPDYVYDGPPGEHVNKIAWDKGIWGRGDNADRNWVISLKPKGGK